MMKDNREDLNTEEMEDVNGGIPIKHGGLPWIAGRVPETKPTEEKTEPKLMIGDF